MKRHIPIWFLCIIIFLFGSGCGGAVASTPTASRTFLPPSKTLSAPLITLTQPVREPTATPSPSATMTATSTSTPMLPTWTPLPTLPPDEAQAMVFELLDTNAGCRLPCWWGITPGVTTLDATLHILSPFTNLLELRAFDQYQRATFRIPFPEEAGTINHTYYIRHNIVEEIEVYNWNYATHTYLPEFLSTYGQPEEVWVRTEHPDVWDVGPFELALFYPSQGILMDTPGGGGGGIEGDILRNCLRDMNWPFLFLWSPEIEITFTEAEEKYLDPDEGYFLPLYDATGMTVAEFYENFKDPNTTACLETPLDLWP